MIPGLLVVGAILAVVVAVSLYLLRRRRSVWERFARRHGLTVVDERELGAPVLGGDVDGRRVWMFAAPESSDTGTLGAEVLCIRMSLAGAVPEGLEVRRATPLDEIGAVPDPEERQELRLEVPDRGVELEVRCPDRQAARRYLDEARRVALAELLELHPGAEAGLEGGEIYLRERELVADAGRLERRFGQLRRLAGRLDAGG